jgi:hypothetical protein
MAELLAFSPNAGPKSLRSWPQTQEPWVLTQIIEPWIQMSDPLALGPDLGSKSHGSSREP